jgi:hypothetical protein
MRPSYPILDSSFRYVPAVATSVAETWRRFGWRPTTDEERKRRQGPAVTLVVDQIAAVRRIELAAPRPEPLATIAAV